MRKQILLLSHLVCGTMIVLGNEYNDKNNINNNVPYIMCLIYVPVTILSAIHVLIHWSYGIYYLLSLLHRERSSMESMIEI